MRKIYICFARKLATGKKNLYMNILTTCIVFTLVSYATKDGVLEEFDSTKACLFSVTMASFWSGICATLSVFNQEKNHILPQLKTNQINVVHYVLASFLVQTLLSIVQSIIGALIFHVFFGKSFDRGIIANNVNFEILITLFLTIHAASTLGFALGMVIHNIKSALSALPMVLILQLLFSRGIFELGEKTEWLSNFIIARYSIAALGASLDINQLPLRVRLLYPMIEQFPNTLFENTPEYLVQCWTCLALLTGLPLIIAVLILEYHVKRKH